ncbi:MAG: hypothetical protein J6Y16_11800 [Treponema sp.]|nr:hypothetical protein [Treponema sp.]
MSVKVIAQLNPFSVERTEFTSDGKTVQEIINNIDARHTSATTWRALVNDEIVTDFSRKIEDGDTVYLKLVPEGDMDNKQMGTAGKVAGGILTVIGVIVGICTSWTGVGGFIGASIAGAGVAMLAGGIVLYNTDIPSLKERKKPEQDPSIRGSRNQMRQMGYVPILLGKRRIYCDLASYSYTWVDPADGAQYLYQLFCIGQKDLQVDTSTIKIDETLLSDYSATGNINSILSGNDPLINMSISYGGITPPLMNKCVHEDQFNTVLKKRTSEDTDGSVIRTTPDGTSEINVDIFFYNGLGRYDDEGNIQSASVTVMAWYKPADSDDSAYQVLGHFNNGSDTMSGNELKTKRYAITKSGLEPGRWTVKISRITDDSSDSKVIDDVYVGSIRSLKNESPVSERRCRELTLVGLKIKASEKLNNVVNQLNLVAQSVLPVYENGAWTTALSSNPASTARYAMQGELSQQRLPDSEIDIPALERLYTWCKNHNYECNAYVTEEMTISELLSSIGSTCRTEIFRMNGKITAVQDIERDSFVQLFSPRNSWGYKETIEFPDIPESMALQIVDKDIGYAENEIVIYNTPSGNKSENTGTTSQDVQLWGVTESEQARKIGMYKYAVSRCRPIVHQFSCDFEYMMCSKGDWIQYAGDMALAGITQGRITRVILDGIGQAVAVETDEEIDATGSVSYGIRIRLSDGSVVIADVENATHVGKQIVFSSPLSENIPSEGDLFLFGYRGHEAIDLIVTDIQCGENLSADITCVEYAPEIFAVDSPDFVLPDWENKLSDVPGIVDDGNVSEWRTWTTFHDGAEKPSRPEGDGTDDGWHRLQTTESMWMSTKNAPTITAGIWSSPVPTTQQVVSGGESIGNPDDITGLSAVASRDYIQLSWNPVGHGLRNSVQYYALQVSFNAGSSWTDAGQSKTNSFDYELSRKGTNYPKYPEATDFANWRFRVKVRSIYNNESSWTTCTVDTTSYGTWILGVPKLEDRTLDRTAILSLSASPQSNRQVYGNIQYHVRIRRGRIDGYHSVKYWMHDTSNDTYWYLITNSRSPDVETEKDATWTEGTEADWESDERTDFTSASDQDTDHEYSYTMAEQTIPADTEWHVPASVEDPYASWQNYKMATSEPALQKDRYVSASSTYTQTLPLYFTDTVSDPNNPVLNLVNTPYYFDVRCVNEAGVGPWLSGADNWVAGHDGRAITALCTNFRDFVKANETAQKAYITELSAITANLGEISEGSLTGDKFNYWLLSNRIGARVPEDYKGAFRVGGPNQYLMVQPVVVNGEIVDYNISLVAQNISFTSSGVDIGKVNLESGTYIYSERDPNIRLHLTARGITVHRKINPSLETWTGNYTECGTLEVRTTSVNGQTKSSLIISNDPGQVDFGLSVSGVTAYHFNGTVLDENGADSKSLALDVSKLEEDGGYIEEYDIGNGLYVGEISAEQDGQTVVLHKMDSMYVNGYRITEGGNSIVTFAACNYAANSSWGLTAEQISQNIFRAEE